MISLSLSLGVKISVACNTSPADVCEQIYCTSEYFETTRGPSKGNESIVHLPYYAQECGATVIASIGSGSFLEYGYQSFWHLKLLGICLYSQIFSSW